jgi:hypothetical protein
MFTYSRFDLAFLTPPHVKNFRKCEKLNKIATRLTASELTVNSFVPTNSLTMVYCKISTDMKIWALQMFDKGWDVGEIVDALAVLSDSILRWQDKYETHGCVDPPWVLQGC